MGILTAIGTYCIYSTICEHERRKTMRVIGEALYRIDHGIGTKRDYDLRDSLLKLGEISVSKH